MWKEEGRPPRRQERQGEDTRGSLLLGALAVRARGSSLLGLEDAIEVRRVQRLEERVGLWICGASVSTLLTLVEVEGDVHLLQARGHLARVRGVDAIVG